MGVSWQWWGVSWQWWGVSCQWWGEKSQQGVNCPPPTRLSPSSEAKLQVHYRRSVHTTTDPYKRAVHCLLARCCIGDNHPEVATKTDDYMWLKVSSPDSGRGHTLTFDPFSCVRFTLGEGMVAQRRQVTRTRSLYLSYKKLSLSNLVGVV